MLYIWLVSGNSRSRVKWWKRPMKKTLFLILSFMVLTVLPGCIKMDMVIKVKRDGSGLLTERMVFTKETIEFFNRMKERQAGDKINENAPPRAESLGAKAGFDIYDEAGLRAKAASLGEGAAYFESRPIDSDEGRGFEVTYALPDITKLMVSSRPRDNVTGVQQGIYGLQEEDLYRLSFVKGSPAKLTVKVPVFRGEHSLAPRAPVSTGEFIDAEKQRQALTVLKQLFKGMRLTVALECEGALVRTNAAHHEGSRVVLVDFDLDRIDFSDEVMERMKGKSIRTLRDMEIYGGNIPGIQVEFKDHITVEFR
jgi:hypothetical protein